MPPFILMGLCPLTPICSPVKNSCESQEYILKGSSILTSNFEEHPAFPHRQRLDIPNKVFDKRGDLSLKSFPSKNLDEVVILRTKTGSLIKKYR
ncbi:hypothetical protein AVEN_146774-1 [Araneus ventricosus]|uniref:Uncharacterized protein n=1 Tax=Araneus ventricosus TaxID=182803 RepID=A0A4Y2D7E3_ARAVE|nr:hypothetical protein AVEN_146774-1 [Araneus ventricosus]